MTPTTDGIANAALVLAFSALAILVQRNLASSKDVETAITAALKGIEAMGISNETMRQTHIALDQILPIFQIDRGDAK